MRREISCNYLWKKWESNDPNGKQVLQARDKINNYSKKNWDDMVIDAQETMHRIGLLIDNSVDIRSKESEDAFDKLLDHVDKYFFTVDKDYVDKLYLATFFDKDYVKFFDQFKPGMANKILELIDAYPTKFK